MYNFNYSSDQVIAYFNDRFQRDLLKCFSIERIEGVDYVKRFSESYIFFGSRDASEDALLVAVLAFMFTSESAVNSLGLNISISEKAAAMNAFGFPWFRAVDHMELSDFLMLKFFDRIICTEKDIFFLREAITSVKLYLLPRFMTFIQEYDNGSIYNRLHSSFLLNSAIQEELIDGVTTLYRARFYTYAGLTGLEFTHREFEDYFLNRFPQQLKEYFSSAKESDGYLHILDVQHSSNRRWDDGSPASNVKDNYMFAAIFLFMTLAEHSILKYVKESERDFHQCTGWPLIYSGPGAGPYLHPLRMLEYAGLAPKKYEAPLLAEVTKHIFPYLRQDMNAILNGRENLMKDPVAGRRLQEAIRKCGRTAIKRYLTRGELEIQNLLATWNVSPAKTWAEALPNNGQLLNLN